MRVVHTLLFPLVRPLCKLWRGLGVLARPSVPIFVDRLGACRAPLRSIAKPDTYIVIMYIAIAGNIGSGKTTLARLLAHHMGYEAHYEDPSANPYIFDFYKDMKHWSFHLQISFLDSRLRQTLQIIRSGQNVVQDRTVYEDAEIFTPNLLSMGLLSQRDYETYRSLYETVIPLITPPDLVIYLRASIPTLVDQIAARNREYEDNLRIDYLKRLNERYNAWFEVYPYNKLDISVDELNFIDNPEDLGHILQSVNAELFGLFQQPAAGGQ